MNEIDELYHHGVKGMKWGVRRTPAQLGHTTSKRKKSSGGSGVFKKAGQSVSKTIKNRKAAKQQKKAKQKPLSEMSDEELRRKIQRLQLEQQYRQLSPKQVSAGQRFISTVGNQVIKPAAINSSRQLLTEAFLKEGRKQMGLQAEKKTVKLVR